MYLLCKKKTTKTWKANLSCRCSNKLCIFVFFLFLFSCFSKEYSLFVCKLLRCWWEAQNDDDYYHHHDRDGRKKTFKEQRIKNKKVQKTRTLFLFSKACVFSLQKNKVDFRVHFCKEEKAKDRMMLMFMTITMFSYVLLCWVVKRKMIIILYRVLYMDVHVFKSIQANCMHSPRKRGRRMQQYH